MMEKDIFDLKDIADLPKTLKNELTVHKMSALERNIIELFNISKLELSLDQILVAYYRKYKKEFTRREMTAKLYNISRSINSPIESIIGRKGIYKLKKGAA